MQDSIVSIQQGSLSPHFSPAASSTRQDANEVVAIGSEDNGQTGMLLRLSTNAITVAGIVPDGAADRSGM